MMSLDLHIRKQLLMIIICISHYHINEIYWLFGQCMLVYVSTQSMKGLAAPYPEWYVPLCRGVVCWLTQQANNTCTCRVRGFHGRVQGF